MYVCNKCGKSFKYKSRLEYHKPYCKGRRICQNPNCNNLLNQGQEKFCCSRCSGLVNSPGRKHTEETRRKISRSLGGKGEAQKSVTCLNCGKILKPGNKYCNNKCQREKNRKDSTEDWLKHPDKYKQPKSFMRYWLIEQHGEKCYQCGWNEVNPYMNKIPLDMHHIDGNSKNHYPQNLILLCPNCHSLTKNYKMGNQGKGREWVREYYQKRRQNRYLPYVTRLADYMSLN